MTHIEYPETTGWEEWMHEYKYGVFLIYPPVGHIEAVDALRQKYDPKSAVICQAHITLSESLQNPLTEDQLKELQEALATIEPFEIQYGPLRAFPPYPGVTFRIEPEDRFMKLREAIHATSIFKDSPMTKKDRAPHMTIAEFGLDWPATEKLMKELEGKVPERSFLCDQIELAVPDKNFHLHRVLKIPLGNSQS